MAINESNRLMQSELLTVKEVGEYLKLSERAVTRMALSGEIPAVKLGRKWRFRRSAIDEWMIGRAAPAGAGKKLSPEAAVAPEPLTVANAIAAERINLNLQAADRDGILRELVALVLPPEDTARAETLFKALKAREDLCSTCVDEGVAIPHARNALVGLVSAPVLAYGRRSAGVEFGALDGKPVQHFFLLCAPNVRQHLHLLARLARLVRDPAVRAGLLAATQPDQVVALLRDAEQKTGQPS
jgi:excisionase family DNA binding protein